MAHLVKNDTQRQQSIKMLSNSFIKNEKVDAKVSLITNIENNV
jgi:hypothetical protein